MYSQSKMCFPMLGHNMLKNTNRNCQGGYRMLKLLQSRSTNPSNFRKPKVSFLQSTKKLLKKHCSNRHDLQYYPHRMSICLNYRHTPAILRRLEQNFSKKNEECLLSNLGVQLKAEAKEYAKT